MVHRGAHGDGVGEARHFELQVGIVGDSHELRVAWSSKNGVIGPAKPDHLKGEGLGPEVGGVPKVTGRSIRPSEVACLPGMAPWKGPLSVESVPSPGTWRQV